MIMNRIVLIAVAIVVLGSCSEDKPEQKAGYHTPESDRSFQMRQTSDINRAFTEEDVKDIEQYLNHPDRNWDIQETGTGIYYYIFEKNDSTPVKSGDVAVLNYQVSLLNGEVCYSSEEDGEATFAVDKEDIESGLHEVVKMMGVGDKGVFIIHHSRAHGLLGDEAKIPPLENVVYRLEVLGVL